ncbi:MAG: aminodeoxychorismate/anthranilate synthase component II [Gemmatimonadota bacterium]
MILLIDNYDSFVHNLARYFAELGEDTSVIRNDVVSAEQALALNPEAIVLSPGPGQPSGAGISTQLVRMAPATLPILGVCLGHQCIAEAFGGATEPAAVPVHGKLTEVRHHGEDLFSGIPSPFQATRYHSLAVPSGGLPDSLRPLAWAADGTLMALRHTTLPVWGVQFHPEALLTEHGHALLQNFMVLGSGGQPAGTAADLPAVETAELIQAVPERDPRRRR